MKARIPTPEPSAAEVQAAEKTNEKNNRAYLNYAHRLLLLSCRAQGFGGVRLRNLTHNSYDVGEDAMARRNVPELITSVEDLMAGAEPEYREQDFLETVEATYWHLRRELVGFGWDPEKKLWERYPFTDADFPKTWRKVSAGQRLKREAFLFFANEMSHICKCLLCMAAVELHRTNEFGCERLDRVMRPVVDRWMQLMRIYLTMDRDAVKAEQIAVRNEFNAMGIFPEEYAL